MVLPLYEIIDKSVDLHFELTQRGSSSTVLSDLETEIASSSEAICQTPPTMEDFASILPWQSERERESRRIAWMCQHIFDARAIGVNIKTFLKSNKHPSPIVAQVAKQTNRPVPTDIIRQHASNVDSGSKNTLPCMLWNKDTEEIHLVECLSFSAAEKISPNLTRGAVSAPLWQDTSPYYGHVRAQAQSVEGLLNARCLLEEALPTLSIRAWVLIASDPDDYPQFQCHDLTSAARLGASGPLRNLDEFEKRYSSISYKNELSANEILFSTIPEGAGYWLNLAPNDRSMQSFAMLEDCYLQQSRSAQFLWLESAVLSSWFEMNYQLISLENQHRHVVEDNLHKHRFFEGRRINDKTTYGLGPKGLVRLLIARNKFSDVAPMSGADIVAEMIVQENKWLAELN
ncbi:MAG: hypothetical protein ACPGYV_07960 [Phycisphaeraceae bacterium]